MKINTKNNKPKFLIAGLVVILLVGAIGTYGYLTIAYPKKVAQNTTPEQTQQSGVVNYDKPTSDQQAAGSTTKDQAASQNTADTSSTSTINVTLHSTTGRLSALLDVVTNTGTCTLTLTGPSSPAPTTVAIQAQSSYSACEGFDTSTLAVGSWTAKVTVESGSQTGTATLPFTVAAQ